MQSFIPLTELKARAQAIGLRLSTLAREASVRPSTVYRAVKTGNAWTRTHGKLSRVLTEKEQARRDDLLKLHPLEKKETAA